MKKADTIFEELNQLHQAISLRAFDLFRAGGTVWGDALTDWLAAERELVSKPAIELRQRDGQFNVVAALPGIDAKDVEVQITPEDLLIQAATTHTHTSDAGTVHVCRARPRQDLSIDSLSREDRSGQREGHVQEWRAAPDGFHCDCRGENSGRQDVLAYRSARTRAPTRNAGI